ncbi:MAG: transposase zinc-binding domain-containing protein, partial [Polyangia bacterium]|nr:transposase zinc-binding domain-containing protein [Polyangia bacterium]
MPVVQRSTRISSQAPVAYERYPGAASARRAGAAIYYRRRPERTALYEAVRSNLETFLATAHDSGGHGYPRFVEHEFRRFLDCGIPAQGFARLRCPDCGHERIVAFSCKGRCLCPSCMGRRMASSAAELVDERLPAVPYRQWVITFPFSLRFALATNRRFLSAVLSAFLGTLFA